MIGRGPSRRGPWSRACGFGPAVTLNKLLWRKRRNNDTPDCLYLIAPNTSSKPTTSLVTPTCTRLSTFALRCERLRSSSLHPLGAVALLRSKSPCFFDETTSLLDSPTYNCKFDNSNSTCTDPSIAYNDILQPNLPTLGGLASRRRPGFACANSCLELSDPTGRTVGRRANTFSTCSSSFQFEVEVTTQELSVKDPTTWCLMIRSWWIFSNSSSHVRIQTATSRTRPFPSLVRL